MVTKNAGYYVIKYFRKIFKVGKENILLCTSDKLLVTEFIQTTKEVLLNFKNYCVMKET